MHTTHTVTLIITHISRADSGTMPEQGHHRPLLTGETSNTANAFSTNTHLLEVLGLEGGPHVLKQAHPGVGLVIFLRGCTARRTNPGGFAGGTRGNPEARKHTRHRKKTIQHKKGCLP